MLTALALVFLADPSQATPGWPCWRGPDGTNVSRERGWRSEGAEETL